MATFESLSRKYRRLMGQRDEIYALIAAGALPESAAKDADRLEEQAYQVALEQAELARQS